MQIKRAKKILSYLPKINNVKEELIKDQTTTDIINCMMESALLFQSQYNLIPINTFYDLEDLWTFTKEVFIYKEDSDLAQDIKSPAVMLTEAIHRTNTIDCKLYSSWIAGIIQSWCNAGEKIDWYFKFVSYGSGDPTHVYIVANNYVLDCCENEFDKESIFFNYICVNPFKINKMAVNRISGKKYAHIGDDDPNIDPQDPNIDPPDIEPDIWQGDPDVVTDYNPDTGLFVDSSGQNYLQNGTPVTLDVENGWYTEPDGSTYLIDGTEINIDTENGFYTELNPDGTNGSTFTYPEGTEINIDTENGFYTEVESGNQFTYPDGTEITFDKENGFYTEVETGKQYSIDGSEVDINYEKGYYTEKDGSQFTLDGTPIKMNPDGTYKDLEDGKTYSIDGNEIKNGVSPAKPSNGASGQTGSGGGFAGGSSGGGTQAPKSNPTNTNKTIPLDAPIITITQPTKDKATGSIKIDNSIANIALFTLGVDIVITKENGDIYKTVKTGLNNVSNGIIIDNLAAGNYLVAFSYMGFNSAARKFVITPYKTQQAINTKNNTNTNNLFTTQNVIIFGAVIIGIYLIMRKK